MRNKLIAIILGPSLMAAVPAIANPFQTDFSSKHSDFMNSLGDVGDRMREDHDSSNRSQAQKYHADQQSFQDGTEAIARQAAENSRLHYSNGANVLYGNGALSAWQQLPEPATKPSVEEKLSPAASSVPTSGSADSRSSEASTAHDSNKANEFSHSYYTTSGGMNRIKRSADLSSTGTDRRAVSNMHALNYFLPFQPIKTAAPVSAPSWRIVKENSSN